MKSPIKVIAILPAFMISIFCRANDGALRVNGNQLIPIYETPRWIHVDAAS